MESRPQNPEFRINHESFLPCIELIMLAMNKGVNMSVISSVFQYCCFP